MCGWESYYELLRNMYAGIRNSIVSDRLVQSLPKELRRQDTRRLVDRDCTNA
jgi:hypothetical protein